MKAHKRVTITVFVTAGVLTMAGIGSLLPEPPVDNPPTTTVTAPAEPTTPAEPTPTQTKVHGVTAAFPEGTPDWSTALGGGWDVQLSRYYDKANAGQFRYGCNGMLAIYQNLGRMATANLGDNPQADDATKGGRAAYLLMDRAHCFAGVPGYN
jgi:hypothetical protein